MRASRAVRWSMYVPAGAAVSAGRARRRSGGHVRDGPHHASLRPVDDRTDRSQSAAGSRRLDASRPRRRRGRRLCGRRSAVRLLEGHDGAGVRRAPATTTCSRSRAVNGGTFDLSVNRSSNTMTTVVSGRVEGGRSSEPYVLSEDRRGRQDVSTDALRRHEQPGRADRRQRRRTEVRLLRRTAAADDDQAAGRRVPPQTTYGAPPRRAPPARRELPVRERRIANAGAAAPGARQRSAVQWCRSPLRN